MFPQFIAGLKISKEILYQLKEILNHDNEIIYYKLKTMVDKNTNTNWDEMVNNMYAQDLADENNLLDVDDDVPNISAIMGNYGVI